jgi:hypothetical protein
MATATLETSWTDRTAVTGGYAKKVLAYTDCIKRTVDAAKAPGFDEAGKIVHLDIYLQHDG